MQLDIFYIIFFPEGDLKTKFVFKTPNKIS